MRYLKNINGLVEAAKNELPIERQFLNDLNYGITLEAEKAARAPSRSYKPSSLQCLRGMYFQMVGEAMDAARPDPNLVGMGESGTDRHARLQAAIAAMRGNGIDLSYFDVGRFVEVLRKSELGYLEVVSRSGYETKLKDTRYNISFLSDGIVGYKGKTYILEIKTEMSTKFWNREDVDPAHYNQAACYSLSFGIDDVLFLYESRDSLEKKAYVLNVTDKMRERVVLKIEECDSYVSQGVAPPKPNGDMRKTCQYCKYKEACRRAG